MNINKTFYTIFLGFAISIFYNPLAIAKCYPSYIKTDYMNHKTYGCYCKDKDDIANYAKGSGINNGFRIFDKFPDMHVCITKGKNHWDTIEKHLCPGFEKGEIPKNATKVAHRSGPTDGKGCWRWECNAGYQFKNGDVNECEEKPAAPPTAENTVLCDDTSKMTVTIGETTYNNVPKNVVFDGKCVKVCENEYEANEKSNIIIADETEFSIRLQ